MKRQSQTSSNGPYWVSKLNLRPGMGSGFNRSRIVRFYDTTLRDGEQTVGVVFDPKTKLAIARKLDELGVSRIEAGFPKVSAEDAEAMRHILAAGLKAEVWGFARATKDDVDVLLQLKAPAAVIEVPTSDIKLKAYGLTRDEVVRRATTAIRHAADHGLKVAFFAVDGTRTELTFLKTIYQAALESGASEVVVVDTIGVCTPEAIYFLVSKVCEWVGKKTPVHFHGHNDFGLATASAIAAVRAGATWIQGTINGMGERAGNADIGEIALALQGLYGIPVQLRLEKIREVSQAVRQAGGYQLEPWKPLVGENLFMRESGAVASQFHIPEAIEPYAASVVAAKRQIVLGKKSGLDSIDQKSRELGLDLPQDRRQAALAAVKQKGIEKRGLVTDDEFREIVLALSARAVP
jgi:isopropylmalate/homocitrate/citramalate synthase